MSPADLSKEYGAPFTIISHDEGFRYNSLLSRDFTPPRSLDFGLIETLGWTKAMDAYCRKLNMEKFVKMKHHGYQELMLEFYTTLSFEDDDDGFQCRLMGKSLNITRKTLCDIFGFREDGHRSVPKNFDRVGFWREISGGGGGSYKDGRPPRNLIKDPILLHMFKYIAHEVFGRSAKGKMSGKDLFYLWCVLRDVRICTPSFLIQTFKSILSNSQANMCLGNLITAIAVHFGVFDPLNTDMTVLPMLPLGVSPIKNCSKKRKHYKEATEETSSSSDQSNGEDTNPVAIDDQPARLSTTPPAVNTMFISCNGENTNPVAIDDQPAGLSTTPPAVDTWMLISCKLEKMQKQIEGGFNAIETRLDELEKKMNDTRARVKTFEQKWVDLRQQESNGTNTVEKLNQGNFEAKKSSDISVPNVNAEDVAVFLPGARLNSDTKGSISKVLSKNGDRNSPQPWTREDDISHTIKNSPGSHSGHNPPPPGSNKYDNNSPEAWIREGDISHTVKKSPCSQTSHKPPQPGSDECKAAGDIIEILDNDDEEKPTGAAESSKRVPSSDEINDLVQRRKRNRSESMDNFFTFSTTKMKKEVCAVDEDAVLIHEKGNKVLKSSHDNVDCSPSERCVEVHESQNPLNDMVSSDSEDEALSDSRMEDLIASLRRENRVRKFMYEADMLRAFQQDDELCLNAVCSLYRQTCFSRKSNERLVLSKNCGFSPIDSMSGCALAEYLIDGDKELRLKKSVSQVKRQRPDVIAQCRKLASIYVGKLFDIYCAGDDPLFCQS